jgi:hypothetical protein
MELDLMIVRKGSNPLKYSNIYKPEDVNTIIEIKIAGVIGTKDDIHSYFKKIKSDFEKIQKKFDHIKFVYITVTEIAETKRDTSINYFRLTEEKLKPFKAYCLFDNHKRIPRIGEWEKFIDEILQ